MKRTVTLSVVALLLGSTLFWAADAWARAGRGGSFGSRGMRGYSAPVRPSPGMSPSRPATPPSTFQQRPGWMGGLMGGIAGFALGGLLGSMLFGGMGGGMGHGLFGGVGLMEIVLMGLLAYFAISFFRRRQQQQAALATAGYGMARPEYGTPQPAGAPSWRPGAASPATITMEAPAGPSDLDQGLAHIRQMDPGFDPVGFGEQASDLFFRIQAAWMARDMGVARDVLTAEMQGILQRDCDALRSQGRINRLENIAVRSVEPTEAWQESGQDFVTVRFLASLLDYTVDEASGQVVAGSRTEPVKFEEHWTWTRPVGSNPWRLSAIQQVA